MASIRKTGPLDKAKTNWSRENNEYRFFLKDKSSIQDDFDGLAREAATMLTTLTGVKFKDNRLSLAINKDKTPEENLDNWQTFNTRLKELIAIQKDEH